jgi:hypothetical protein
MIKIVKSKNKLSFNPLPNHNIENHHHYLGCGGRLQLFCLWWQSQILKRRIFSYAFLKLTSKCAAMWDSQNGFAEKCAVA